MNVNIVFTFLVKYGCIFFLLFCFVLFFIELSFSQKNTERKENNLMLLDVSNPSTVCSFIQLNEHSLPGRKQLGKRLRISTESTKDRRGSSIMRCNSWPYITDRFFNATLHREAGLKREKFDSSSCWLF